MYHIHSLALLPRGMVTRKFNPRIRYIEVKAMALYPKAAGNAEYTSERAISYPYESFVSRYPHTVITIAPTRNM